LFVTDFVEANVRRFRSLCCTGVLTGNENIHTLTNDARQRLRIDLTYRDGEHRYAEYDNFCVGGEGLDYVLRSIGNYTGNAS